MSLHPGERSGGACIRSQDESEGAREISAVAPGLPPELQSEMLGLTHACTCPEPPG